jgi:hydroxymethylglutaryl-CoA lyase
MSVPGSSAKNGEVKIVECPRDAWQGLSAFIPSETKAAYLRKLIDAGFKSIDAVSFVSPAAVPQMADSERVLELLRPPAHIEIVAIVVNRKGAERAIATGSVRTLGFPFSVSSEFLRRNQHQTPQAALEELGAIMEMTRSVSLNSVVYLSMAFGNPYDDPWSASAVAEACDQIAELGARQISLADTVGLASPERITETIDAAIVSHPAVEFGAHLHARRIDAPQRVRAAFNAGCRRFDAAIGGIGGCPFAQDALVGNIPTEILLAELAARGATQPKIGSLDELIQQSATIAANAGAPA